MGFQREESKGSVEKNQFVMLVAALVAFMAFAAVTWPPGGYWPRDGPSPDHVEYVAGSPKMAYLSPRTYLFLVILYTAAYVGSMTIALSFLIRDISSLVHDAFGQTQMGKTVVLMVMTSVSFCSMSMAFAIILGVVAPSQYRTTSYILVSLVQVWSCLTWTMLPGYFIWRKITQ